MERGVANRGDLDRESDRGNPETTTRDVSRAADDITPDERKLDEVLADSFPASDPPPWTLGTSRPRRS
jgi:hypothetical protein